MKRRDMRDAKPASRPSDPPRRRVEMGVNERRPKVS
jgi:hypothetical protein